MRATATSNRCSKTIVKSCLNTARIESSLTALTLGSLSSSRFVHWSSHYFYYWHTYTDWWHSSWALSCHMISARCLGSSSTRLISTQELLVWKMHHWIWMTPGWQPQLSRKWILKGSYRWNGRMLIFHSWFSGISSPVSSFQVSLWCTIESSETFHDFI